MLRSHSSDGCYIIYLWLVFIYIIIILIILLLLLLITYGSNEEPIPKGNITEIESSAGKYCPIFTYIGE